MKIALTAPIEMSIDQALDFIEDDELIEITPQNVRLRKKFLSKLDRTRASRK
jgi:GTP-binding protein